MTAPKQKPSVEQVQVKPISIGQVKQNPKSYAGEKIVVASKLPMALQIQLQASRVETKRERATTWEETVFYKHGPVVIINGTAFPNGEVPEGWERPQMASGCALTFNVDRDFFEQWLDQNKQHPAVANNMIFAAVKSDAVKGMAKDFKAIDSGLGPIAHAKDKDGNDVVTDKRMPKKQSAMRAMRGGSQEESAFVDAE